MNPIRILLVEDDKAVASTVPAILKRHLASKREAVFDVAHCLADAIDLLDQNTYDLILSDLRLPDSDGVNTIKDLHEVARSTPIIAMSAVYEDGTGLSLISAGADDFFLKSGDNIFKGLARRILFSVEHRNRNKKYKKAQAVRSLYNLLEQVA